LEEIKDLKDENKKMYDKCDDLGPVSQKVVNRTISDLSYDHLPTKFATVSQNYSECFFTISDLRLVVVKSSLCGGTKIDQFPEPRTYQINSLFVQAKY
jgi:hypothetical protein